MFVSAVTARMQPIPSLKMPNIILLVDGSFPKLEMGKHLVMVNASIYPVPDIFSISKEVSVSSDALLPS